MTSKLTMTDERIGDVIKMAQEAAKIYGGEWDSALIAESPGNNVHGITSEHTESVIVRTDDDSLHSSWVCDYLESVSPAFVIAALRELQDRRNVEKDSEPVAWTWHYREQWHVTNDKCRAEFVAKDGDVAVLPLYRHAQQPVVPNDVLDALQKVARIRLDMNDFDGDRRGIADCLGDAEEALIEVVNRRAAMLSGGKS